MTLHTLEQIGMPLEEFSRLQEEQPFDLIDGERISKLPNYWSHSWLIRFLFVKFYAYVTEVQIGEMFQETTYAQLIGGNWVKGSRIPDLMFFAAGRVDDFLASVQGDTTLPFAIAPDLTIEVLSPTETAIEINKKVAADQRNGVRLIWVIDPVEKLVTEYFDGKIIQLFAGDHLDGKDILRGFGLSLDSVFAELSRA